jgi:cell wall-associated NlpC family hydrolase
MSGAYTYWASQAQPGDLVFFDGSDGPMGDVGLYMGDGFMIDAQHTGTVTRIELVWLPYPGFRRVT